VSANQPLVSVLTPVYNGEEYLAECIESVLAQSYGNWEYTIVNNCSTDKTLGIAERYAARDTRIKVMTNTRFVDAISNHNIAFRQISPQSKYCKLISADDWIYPDCLERLVERAEGNPSVGIVLCYALTERGVRWTGVQHDATVLQGREAGRLYLLNQIEFASIPTTLLFRSSLVRSRDPFFPGHSLSADAAACLECLQTCDFGVVHQILSFQRLHKEMASTSAVWLDSYRLDRLELLQQYSPLFLTEQELKERLDDVLRDYFSTLAVRAIHFRNKDYWDYQRMRLTQLGFKLYGRRFAKALVLKISDLLLNPKCTVEKVLRGSAAEEQLTPYSDALFVGPNGRR
jgi:glycosyltransferase involved in cell wall biosynthesis